MAAIKGFKCNDCKLRFKTRPLKGRREHGARQCVQHWCAFYSKVITRVVGLYSERCLQKHAGPCVVLLPPSDCNFNDETKRLRARKCKAAKQKPKPTSASKRTLSEVHSSAEYYSASVPQDVKRLCVRPTVGTPPIEATTHRPPEFQSISSCMPQFVTHSHSHSISSQPVFHCPPLRPWPPRHSHSNSHYSHSPPQLLPHPYSNPYSASQFSLPLPATGFCQPPHYSLPTPHFTNPFYGPLPLPPSLPLLRMCPTVPLPLPPLHSSSFVLPPTPHKLAFPSVATSPAVATPKSAYTPQTVECMHGSGDCMSTIRSPKSLSRALADARPKNAVIDVTMAKPIEFSFATDCESKPHAQERDKQQLDFQRIKPELPQDSVKSKTTDSMSLTADASSTTEALENGSDVKDEKKNEEEMDGQKTVHGSEVFKVDKPRRRGKKYKDARSRVNAALCTAYRLVSTSRFEDCAAMLSAVLSEKTTRNTLCSQTPAILATTVLCVALAKCKRHAEAIPWLRTLLCQHYLVPSVQRNVVLMLATAYAENGQIMAAKRMCRKFSGIPADAETTDANEAEAVRRLFERLSFERSATIEI